MLATIDLPTRGIYFIHESFHAGGTAAIAMSLLRSDALVGTLKSEDSSVRSLGQSSDQLTESGGRALSRRKF